MTGNERKLLVAYGKLHDWLSDVVEEGERNRRDFPIGQLIVKLRALTLLDNIVCADKAAKSGEAKGE